MPGWKFNEINGLLVSGGGTGTDRRLWRRSSELIGNRWVGTNSINLRSRFKSCGVRWFRAFAVCFVRRQSWVQFQAQSFLFNLFVETYLNELVSE